MSKVFPLRDLLVICKGCGSERQVPESALARILSADDFTRFVATDLAGYTCRCGSRLCDMRMLPCEPLDDEVVK